jgi:hypothetical protein
VSTYTNRGSNGVSVITINESDETTDYPAGSPPALVSPQTYDLTWAGARVRIGKPRIAFEQFGIGSEFYTWFVAFSAFGRSGKYHLSALLDKDSNDNKTQTNTRILSSDFGFTWSLDTQADTQGFIFDEWWDASTGRIRWVSGTYRPNPLGQHRTYACDRGWYANGGVKRVRWPWGATLTGLPWDLAVNPPPGGGIVPRHAWDHCYAYCKPLKLSNGDLLRVIYVIRTGQVDTTGVVIKSTDDGATWTYLSHLGLEGGHNESTLVQSAGGGVIALCRNPNFGGISPARNPPTTAPPGTRLTP